jgi:anthranilate 1,2-dioxygenase small subunit
MSSEIAASVIELLYDYVSYIDDDRLEEWIDFFLEDAEYLVMPRENVEQNLAASLIWCPNKNVLRDRILALRNANKYNLHWGRHLVSAPRVKKLADDLYSLTAAYSVFQTNLDGESKLFSVGQYKDEIRIVDGKPFFWKKQVIVDSFLVPNLLAVPL